MKKSASSQNSKLMATPQKKANRSLYQKSPSTTEKKVASEQKITEDTALPTEQSDLLLKIMSGDDGTTPSTEEEEDEEVKSKSFFDVKCPSPVKYTLDKTRLMSHHGKANEWEYSMVAITQAATTKPMPSFEFLANLDIPADQKDALLEDMMFTLGAADLSSYSTYLNPGETEVTINPALIPPLGPSLREWVYEVLHENRATMSHLFMCVQRPDPLSYPQFAKLYQCRVGQNPIQAEKRLCHAVHIWNQSQMLLANVLHIALKKALAQPNLSIESRRTLQYIEHQWIEDSEKDGLNFGHVMYWQLKGVLHRDAKTASSQLKKHINNYAMEKNPTTGTPKYIDWVKKIYAHARALKEYDLHGVDEDSLLQLFMEKYRAAIDQEQIMSDPILKLVSESTFTWNDLVKRIQQIDIEATVTYRTQASVLTNAQWMTYTPPTVAALTNAPMSKSKADRNSNKSTKSDRKAAPAVQWSDNQDCAIHKGDTRAGHHINSRCRLQQPIRASGRPLTELIPQLEQLRKDFDKKEAARKSKPTSLPQAKTGTVANAVFTSGAISSSSDTSVHSTDSTSRTSYKRKHDDIAHESDRESDNESMSIPFRHANHVSDKTEEKHYPSRCPGDLSDGFSETSEDIREAEARARRRQKSNTDRRDTKRDFRQVTNQLARRNAAGEVTLHGRTLSQAVHQFMDQLRIEGNAMGINKAKDNMEDSWHAEIYHRRSGEYVPSLRRLLLDAGLRSEHLHGKSKYIQGYILDTLQVRTRSPPIHSTPLTPFVNSASSNHSPKYKTKLDVVVDVASRVSRSSNMLISNNTINAGNTIHVVTSPRITRVLLLRSTVSEYDSIIDTGATSHILRDAIYASAHYKFCKSNTQVSLGDHTIQLAALGTCTVGILRNALIVPKMSLNLISGSCLEQDGYSLVVRDSKCTILNHKGGAIFHATLHEGLYYFNMNTFIKTCSQIKLSDVALVAKVKKPTIISTKLDVELLHKRFGHASIEDVISGLKNGAITGFTIDAKRHHGKYQLQNGVCIACMKAKAHKPPFYISLRLKASAPGEYVVCDIQGPFSVETLTGETYVITYTDWYSRYSWTFLLKHKSEALSKLKYLVEVVFQARRVFLRHYHSDQAGELQGSETMQYLENTVHATHSESEAYTPARNSIAERKFRTLGEMTAAMLFDSGLPKPFWGYAYLAATHIRNRIPTVVRGCSLTARSPYELWHGTIPNMHYIRRWGCKCFVYIPKQLRDKSFPDKVQTGFLVGFTAEGSYDAYIPARAKVVGSTVQIQFDEDIPSHSESYFEELHQQDHVIDTTDKNNPMTPKDFHYLIGTKHIDDEDGLLYETTRIAIQNNQIVAFRALINADGQRNRQEDSTPIHVKDIARLTTHCPSSGAFVEKTTTGVGNTNTLGKLTGMPQPHHNDLKPILTGTAVTGPSTSNHGISITSNGELSSEPDCATRSSPTYNLRKRVTFNILSDRESKVRKTTCLTTRGHIASHSTSPAVPGQVSSEPNSTFRTFHAMVERNEFNIEFVPATYKQAMQSTASHYWQEAITKELSSIEANKVFSIVDRPPGVKLQTGRFLFKIKYTGQGTIYKARLIAHGFKQIAGADYWETYAPVSSTISTRIFLTICATYNMSIHQMDIDTAFLIANLTEDLYMAPPVGMAVPEGKVLKLHKCLYGLKQSPRYFNQHLVNTLLNLGFENLINEPCLFHKMVDGKQVLASIYVDDILIACSDVEIIKSIKILLASTYKMKDLGDMDWYLGMRCKRNHETGIITLDQTKYTEDVLSTFDEWIGSCQRRYVPMQPNLVLQKWTQEYDKQLTPKQLELIQRFPYRQIIGSLLYISIWTRPDISYAIGKLAKFNNHPTVEAIHATQWLLQYMQGTKQLGLTFIPGDMRISTYVDSSFGDVVSDKRSTAGQITYLGKSPIQWDSFVCDNYSVPCSVAEAEYIAASEAARVMLSNRNILIQLGYPQDQMFMFEDNQACISIAMQESSKRKTKHVELQVHHIRDLLKSGRIVMVHITTNIQLADIFTKPLNEEVFNRHLSVILGNEPAGDLLLFLNSTKEYNKSVDLKDDDEDL